MSERTSRRVAWCGLFVSACLLASSPRTQALTDEEIFRELGFDFRSPGARALGMGGASIAVANDASLAVANPAGLVFLAGPQAFVELRALDSDPRLSSSTRGSLEVDTTTGDRDLPYLGVTSVSDPASSADPGLVVAWPLRLGSRGRRLTLAASRQVVLSDERSLRSTDGQTEARFAFDTYPNTVRNGQLEAYSVAAIADGEISADIVYYGVAASLEVTDDFAFGVGLNYATLDIRASTATQLVDPLEIVLDPSHPRLPPRPDSDVYRSSIDDTDSGFAYTVGIDWHPNSVYSSGESPWRLGAVLRRGASFTFAETTSLNDIPDPLLQVEMAVPDRFGLGISYVLRPFWTLALDFERIEYTDLLDGLESGVNVLTNGRVAAGSFVIDPDAEIAYTVDNGNVWRLGAEYARGRFAAWAGYYRTPDSRIRMTAFNSDDADINATYVEAFGGGDAADHFTLGVGYEMGRSAFQIAGAFADEGSTVVGSYTFSWKTP